jgi:DNA-binding transcriptional LysR family regulator
VAIGAGPFAGEISVAKAIVRVVDAHPRLQIRFDVADPDQVVQDVLAGRIDVGVASTVDAESDVRLMVETLPPLQGLLACRPDHLLAGNLPLARAGARVSLGDHSSVARKRHLRQGPAPQESRLLPRLSIRRSSNSLAHARLDRAGQ